MSLYPCVTPDYCTRCCGTGKVDCYEPKSYRNAYGNVGCVYVNNPIYCICESGRLKCGRCDGCNPSKPIEQKTYISTGPRKPSSYWPTIIGVCCAVAIPTLVLVGYPLIATGITILELLILSTI